MFIPSRELIVESYLDYTTFLNRLVSHVEPQKHGFKLRVRKDFEGEVYEDGSFKLTYGRGFQLTGNVSPWKGGTQIRMRIGLPRNVLAFGLAFAWGTFVIGLTGVVLIAASRQHFSLLGFLKAVVVVMIPSVITYGIFFLNLRNYVGFVNEFFENTFKQ